MFVLGSGEGDVEESPFLLQHVLVIGVEDAAVGAENIEHRNEENSECLDVRSKAQQVAEGGFDFRHLGGAEYAHAAGEFAVIETG